MGTLTPAQLLLWILGLEIISAPIIFSLAGMIIDRYHEAKYRGLSNLINSYIKAWAEMVNKMSAKESEDISK